MKPIKMCLLVELDPPDEKTESGLFVPNPEEKNSGKVLEVGTQLNYIKPGDRVTFHKNHGYPVNYHGKKCRLLNEAKKEVIAIL